MGKGADFLALPWVKMQLGDLLSQPPYPGTLNLLVGPEIHSLIFARRKSFFCIADPSDPSCPGYLKSILMRTSHRSCESGFLIVPDRSVYEDVLEIVSAVHLRSELGVSDGDRVDLEVDIE